MTCSLYLEDATKKKEVGKKVLLLFLNEMSTYKNHTSTSDYLL